MLYIYIPKTDKIVDLLKPKPKSLGLPYNWSYN